MQRAGKLVIKKRDITVPPPLVEIPGPGTYLFGPFVFQIDMSGESNHRSQVLPEPGRIVMDAERIKWPLRIRSWKPGDRFCPLGMKGTKKLHDYFIDSKIPREERTKVPILCDSEKICWVAGLRMDDRVKTSPKTREIVTVRFSLSGTA